MYIPNELVCRTHQAPLSAPGGEITEEVKVLVCHSGCRIQVIRRIPRFVEATNYASGFGLQWNAFRKTQLDSHTGTTLSRDRLTRCFGGSLDVVRDKKVLEVGCGAGRFTELLLENGAKVFACDLSNAVEANYENCHHWPHYFVCQANALEVPAPPNSFDFVLCVGVIQHTPSPEKTIAALATHVKPGGILVIDHYTHWYRQNFLQRNLRRALIRLPSRIAKPLTLMMARALFPLHRFAWKNRHGRGIWRLRPALIKHSPIIDYQEPFPELGEKLVAEWSVLDTHDALTDYYKHLRTREEIEACLRSSGLVDVEAWYDGNGVEARAKMPASAVAYQRGAAG
jgi:2-polyprenyl-3-methyl-5-hydroxy-6-metoxy-1,4-benzoquinol methylase